MYEWLTDSLDRNGTVITANRRLARTLAAEYAQQQQARDRTAWKSPNIVAWSDWLQTVLSASSAQHELATRITAQQSQWLWEKCLRQQLPDQSSGFGHLVRLCRDAWQKLSDWQVDSSALAQSAQNLDQRHYAQTARRYQALLAKRQWLDDAGLAPLVLDLLRAEQDVLSGHLVFAGFDRVRPIVQAIANAATESGINVRWINSPSVSSARRLSVYESPEEEYRAAGQWARQQIDADPSARLAIIATGLENNGTEISRWVREGATPGWQYGSRALRDAVNVSFGQPLAQYPGIAIALLCLRWSIEDVSAADVSVLLRSGCIASNDLGARARLELQLRELPDRPWSPAMVGALLRDKTNEDDSGAWFSVLAEISKRRRELPSDASPSQWAVFFNGTLKLWRWPGSMALDSAEFQLINRWREALNELARLNLVSQRMSASTALSRLQLMASETLHQAESDSPLIQLIGPLEAAGMLFDKLWVSGMTANDWPPAGTPLPLVARQLQESNNMPDATPTDTAAYADIVVSRLMNSAPNIEVSYSTTVDDTDQTVSELLGKFIEQGAVCAAMVAADPGWHANHLRCLSSTVEVTDRVPRVESGEKIAGGAGTLQRQLTEPASAFIYGRLGARPLYPQAVGLPPSIRGILVHDALYYFYRDLPRRDDLLNRSDEDSNARIDSAVDTAFLRQERHSGFVLQRIFALERHRVKTLLQQFVVVDSQRPVFKVDGVEGQFNFTQGTVNLLLRFDRIDTYEDGTISILDYKTGTKKQLVSRDGDIQEIQLFVYALAADRPVSSLALANIDSRSIDFSGAGIGYSSEENWEVLLRDAQDSIQTACTELAAGDVRINIEQGVASARPLNLLTRYTELRRDRR